MPTLAQFRQYHYDATVKVSESTRTLALSAIGIIWLFKQGAGTAYSMPQDLMMPLFLIVSALALDFSQHVFRSAIWHWLFRCKEDELEKGNITEESELYVGSWVNTAAYVFFYLKTLCLVAAYWFLLDYLVRAVRWV